MMRKIPNYLTTLRMLMVIVLVAIWLLSTNEGPTFSFIGSSITVSRLVILALFVIASFTDFLDGYLARKYNVISTYGKLMDPIADKLLVNSTLLLLAFDHQIPAIIPIIMIGRDTFVDALRMIMAEKKIVISAGPWGKMKTVLQMIGIITVLSFTPVNEIAPLIPTIILYLATVISIYSGIDYYMKSMKGLHD